MRHLLHITVLLLFSFSSITAQETNVRETRKTTFGIIAGGNVYDFEPGTSYSTNSDELIHAYGGFFINRKLSNRFSLQLETLFLKGINKDNQIEIPLHVNYRINNKFDVYLGVQANMLLNKNVFFNKFGGGFHFGMRYNISKKWFIDARYVSRFSHLKDSFNTNGNNKESIGGIRLGVGYRF